MNFNLLKELELQKWVQNKGLNVVCHITFIDRRDNVKANKITLFYNETLLYNKQFIFECMLKGNVQLFEFDFVRDEISNTPLDLNLRMWEAYPDKLVFMKERKRKTRGPPLPPPQFTPEILDYNDPLPDPLNFNNGNGNNEDEHKHESEDENERDENDDESEDRSE